MVLFLQTYPSPPSIPHLALSLYVHGLVPVLGQLADGGIDARELLAEQDQEGDLGQAEEAVRDLV